ncbi:odorant receptor 47a-like [Diachasmimorpha longicaudata]|uniref:odorant receptor 47a-like n=1 Tax=Diachasmimorpha longicaudata TaxID=58733 RepID=UPI0030B8E21E
MFDEKKLPEIALTYLKYGTSLLCTWPPSTRATKSEKLSIDAMWWLLCILAWCLVLPVLYTAYLTRGNFMEFTKNICFGASIAHGIIKMIICKYQRKKYQKLLEEIENYLLHATPREREVLNGCVKRAAPVYLSFNITGFVAAASYVWGPLVLDQDLPMDVVYPFEIHYYPVFQIVYTFQAISTMQCAAVGPLDAQVCMLFWFTIARLKLLAHDVKSIASVGDLNACVRVHQSILRFNEQACDVARPIIMTTLLMATLSIAFGAMHVIGHEPFEVKAQFVGLDIGYGAQLYLSAWAAENLMTAMENLKWALYDSSWSENSKSLSRSFLFVLQKLNKIPTVSVGGFIPELSLNYYAVYLSKTMSFFTTLRIMLQKMEEEKR